MKEIPRFTKTKRNRFILEVDSGKNGDFSGRAIEILSGESTAFSSFANMLLLLEEIMDDSNYPQRALEKRFFGKEPIPPGKDGPAELPRPTATFQLEVIFRQNGSWQGDLTWVNTNTQSTFRSVLELLYLIQSALCGAEKTADTTKNKPAC